MMRYLITFFLGILLLDVSGQKFDKLRFSAGRVMPHPLYDMAFTYGDNRAYFIGGGTNWMNVTNSFLVYNFQTNDWYKLHKSFDTSFINGSALFMGQYESLFILTGRNLRFRRQPNEVISYNLKTLRGRVLGENPLQSTNTGLVTWNEKVYLFGGERRFKGIGSAYTDGFVEFDPSDGSIRELPTMPRIIDVQGLVIDDKLYVLGVDSTYTNLHIYSFDFITNRWAHVDSQQRAASSFALASYQNHLFLIGGHSMLNLLKSFDLTNSTWKTYKIRFGGRTMKAVVHGDYLHVFGGISWEYNKPTARHRKIHVKHILGGAKTQSDLLLGIE